MTGISRRKFLGATAGLGGLALLSALPPTSASRPKNAMLVEVGKCIGCMKCVSACADYHKQFYNEKLEGLVYTKVPLVEGKKPVPQNCLHCVDAPCAVVCQSHAIEQLDSGAVVYDREDCIGCLECVTVCPFESITYDAATKRIFKCDFCSKQTENGGVPNCVAVCPPFAKTWGPYEQKLQEGLALAKTAGGKLLYADDTATLLVLSESEFGQLLNAAEVTVVKPQYPLEYKSYSALVKWSRLAWVPFFAGTVLFGLAWRSKKEGKEEAR